MRLQIRRVLRFLAGPGFRFEQDHLGQHDLLRLVPCLAKTSRLAQVAFAGLVVPGQLQRQAVDPFRCLRPQLREEAVRILDLRVPGGQPPRLVLLCHQAVAVHARLLGERCRRWRRGHPARIRPAGYCAGLAGGRGGGAGAWQRTGGPGCPGRVAGPRSTTPPRTAVRRPAPTSVGGSLSCPVLGWAADDRPGGDLTVRLVVDIWASGQQQVPGAVCGLPLCIPDSALIGHDGVLLTLRRGCGLPVAHSSASRPQAEYRISDLNKTVADVLQRMSCLVPWALNRA